MLDVCATCFGGDWVAMQKFARRHNENNKEELGKAFREIIGTRNRTMFWQDVASRESPSSSAEEIVDGDSLDGIKRAIERCRKGKSTLVTLAGRVIGKLIPHDGD
jgi:hypothetical protein